MNTNLVLSSSVFSFGAEHNGVPCIVSTRPEDQGTEQQLWFTRQMLRDIFDVKSDNTIANHVEVLLNRGIVNELKNLSSLNVKNESGNGAVKTTLYDLKVLNFLAMRLDTDRAWEVKEKFNDILVKEETNRFPIPETFEDALILAGQQMKLAKEEERKRIQAEKECAELKRTKAFISAGREATALAKLGGATKALICEKEKNTKLIKENDELKEQNEILKVSIGESNQWMSSAQLIQNFNLQRINGKDMQPRTLTIMLKKLGCKHRESEFPDAKGYKYAIFFVEDVKKALNIF